MDNKCHDLVYMNLWPNMSSVLWSVYCTRLPVEHCDFASTFTFMNSITGSYSAFPLLVLTKTKSMACVPKPLVVWSSHVLQWLHIVTFGSDIWIVLFVISRESHHGLLQKNDTRRRLDNDLDLEGTAVPSWRRMAFSLLGHGATFVRKGDNVHQSAFACTAHSHKTGFQHRATSTVQPRRKDVKILLYE